MRGALLGWVVFLALRLNLKLQQLTQMSGKTRITMGFTLIELLVVIAIIAILAAMLFFPELAQELKDRMEK